MGLFKSKEEKEAEKQAKMKQWLADHSLEDLAEDDYDQVKRIQTQLWGTSFMGTLNMISASDKDLLRNVQNVLLGISEQNWLLIKQNDKLEKQNEELIELLKKKPE